jgi:hypothetical protein
MTTRESGDQATGDAGAQAPAPKSAAATPASPDQTPAQPVG